MTPDSQPTALDRPPIIVDRQSLPSPPSRWERSLIRRLVSAFGADSIRVLLWDGDAVNDAGSEAVATVAIQEWVAPMTRDDIVIGTIAAAVQDDGTVLERGTNGDREPIVVDHG
jgi:hypothetical protein